MTFIRRIMLLAGLSLTRWAGSPDGRGCRSCGRAGVKLHRFSPRTADPTVGLHCWSCIDADLTADPTPRTATARMA